MSDSNFVGAHELVRRVSWLSNRFKNHKVKIPIGGWEKVTKGRLKRLEHYLTEKGVNYQIFDTAFSNTYSSDLYDKSLILNTNKRDELVLSKDITLSFSGDKVINLDNQEGRGMYPLLYHSAKQLFGTIKSDYGVNPYCENEIQKFQTKMINKIFRNRGTISFYKSLPGSSSGLKVWEI